MTNKRCFLVTAYCNTPEKKKVLNDTLSKLKKYNIDIILFSHYPIDEDVYELTEYSIYDYSNPVFENIFRPIVNWSKFAINGLSFKINTNFIDDFGYAAVQQIKRGLLFANEIGYDEAFVLNYDLIVYDKMIEDFERWIEDYDSIMLECEYRTGVKGLYMPWFGLKIKPFNNNLKTISEHDYRNFSSDVIAEEYLYPKFRNENSKLIHRLEWEGSDPQNGLIKASIITFESVLNKFRKDNFNWFIGYEIYKQNNERVDSGKQLLMLWDIKKNLSVDIYLRGELFNSCRVPKQLKYHIIYLPIEHNEFQKDPSIVKIVINNWEIPREMLILNRISFLEMAYNEE